MTCSDGLEVAEPSTAVISKTSWSMMTPSAFSPSTSAMLTVVGVIDTPSTISTAPPTRLLGRFGSWRGARPTQAVNVLPPIAADHFRRVTSTWARAGPVRKTLLAQSSPDAGWGEIVEILPASIC